MTDRAGLPFPAVDGLELPDAERRVLRPAARLTDRAGRVRRLPRFFYRVDSWQEARQLMVTPNFRLSEFLQIDVREAEPQRSFPRHLPCAAVLLAAHLEVFRQAVGTFVHIAANGGYRSPAHALTRGASPHCWGTAANLYRIGDDFLDDRKTIDRYVGILRDTVPALWIRPPAGGSGFADDHIHVDLGYAHVVPHDGASDIRTDDEPLHGEDAEAV